MDWLRPLWATRKKGVPQLRHTLSFVLSQSGPGGAGLGERKTGRAGEGARLKKPG